MKKILRIMSLMVKGRMLEAAIEMTDIPAHILIDVALSKMKGYKDDSAC